MATETTKLSPNVSAKSRLNLCKGVVWHHSDGSYVGGVEWITDPASKVSYHCLIAKNGNRTIFAPDERVCWHAGESRWREKSFCNSFTVGCAFEGNTYNYTLTTAQLKSAIEWLASRAIKHKWTLADMTTHRAISPGRKNDISPAAEKILWEALRTVLKS